MENGTTSAADILLGQDKKNISDSSADIPNQNEKFNVVFHDALGQWENALKKLLIEHKPNDFNSEIVKWPTMSMENTNDITIGKHKDIKLHEKINGKDSMNNFHIFVSPITWAAKYNDQKKLKLIGPAFGTYEDIYLYFTHNSLKNRINRNFKDNPVRVGVIQRQLTSSIMLKILFYLFHKGNDKILKLHKDHYRFEDTDEDDSYRLDQLSKGNYDFSLFTTKELDELKKTPANKSFLDKLGHFLKVDDLYAHLFNLEFVPRSVYCVHEEQMKTKKYQYDKIKKWLKSLPNNEIDDKMISINPSDKKMRDILDQLVKNAEVAGESIKNYCWEII